MGGRGDSVVDVVEDVVGGGTLLVVVDVVVVVVEVVVLVDVVVVEGGRFVGLGRGRVGLLEGRGRVTKDGSVDVDQCEGATTRLLLAGSTAVCSHLPTKSSVLGNNFPSQKVCESNNYLRVSFLDFEMTFIRLFPQDGY